MNILKKFEVRDTHERTRSDFSKGYSTKVAGYVEMEEYPKAIIKHFGVK